MRELLLVLFVSFLSFNLCAQDDGFALGYIKLVEYDFNKSSQDYKVKDTIKQKGLILIHPDRIAIAELGRDQSKTYLIKSKEIDPESKRVIYKCKYKKKNSILALSSDRLFLTVITTNSKTVYFCSDSISKVLPPIGHSASNTSSFIHDEAVFVIVEEMPLFNGAKNKDESNEMVYQYIEEKVKEAPYIGKGIVYLNFIVNELGQVEKVKVARGVNEALDNRAKEIISGMPQWKPGLQRKKPVKVSFTIPVKF